jgi:hypothetical protein
MAFHSILAVNRAALSDYCFQRWQLTLLTILQA